MNKLKLSALLMWVYHNYLSQTRRIVQIMASESKLELEQRLLVSLRLFTILVVALICMTDSLSCRLCCMYYLKLLANQNTRSFILIAHILGRWLSNYYFLFTMCTIPKLYLALSFPLSPGAITSLPSCHGIICYNVARTSISVNSASPSLSLHIW